MVLTRANCYPYVMNIMQTNTAAIQRRKRQSDFKGNLTVDPVGSQGCCCHKSAVGELK